MDFVDSVIAVNRKILKFLDKSDSRIFDDVNVGAGGDMSKVVDIESEKIFIKHLSKFGKIISEECGECGEGEDEIIIDPIDGSENIISGLPYFGSSVARKKDGKVKDAIVVNFANGDIFVKNDDGLKRAKIDKLNFSEVTINNHATIGIYERAYASKEFIYILNEKKIKYRSPGAVALSLAYAHDVKFVMFEGKAREYDVCAGLYMCEDLSIYERDDFLIISKEKDMFVKLVKIVEGKK